jgi:hypothetical protein
MSLIIKNELINKKYKIFKNISNKWKTLTFEINGNKPNIIF